MLPKPSPDVIGLWNDLGPRREAALALARRVEPDSLDESRRNRDDLTRLTTRLNALIEAGQAGPLTNTLRYAPGIRPPAKNDLARAIWLYKAARQIAAYNAAHAPEMSADELEVITRLNAWREAFGAMPLEFNPKLRQAALLHSGWIEAHQDCNHEEPDVPAARTYDLRINHAGYRWISIGENIALGHPSAAVVMNGWFESTHHQQNLYADWLHLGVGRVGNSWTQEFATGEPARAISYHPPTTLPARPSP